jgi:hypothetical protein
MMETNIATCIPFDSCNRWRLVEDSLWIGITSNHSYLEMLQIFRFTSLNKEVKLQETV